MMRRRIDLVVLLLATCIPGVAAERRDGNWWRGLTTSERFMYVTGFFDGMDLGNNFSYWGIKNKDGVIDLPVARRAMSSYDEYSAKFFKEVTNSQVGDGLSAFYEDYRNRTIRVSDAVWLVVNSIAGKSDEEMKPLIENFRKGAANK
jgi:hypothetical protein